MSGLATCHAFWKGSHLGPVAAACLNSFISAGHRVVLHSYEPVADAPEGVICEDAGRLVPADKLIQHEATGSYSLFSNYFRYRLLQEGMGIYIDCDMVCIRPIADEEDYLFGWQDDRQINGAILKLPSESMILENLIHLFDKRIFLAPWMSWKDRRKVLLRALGGRKADVSIAPWGSAGPTALTWYTRAHGLTRFAAHPEVYYPVHYSRAEVFLDPDTDWRALFTARTRCVHLWNKMLQEHGIDQIPRGSPLWQLVEGKWPQPVMYTP